MRKNYKGGITLIKIYSEKDFTKDFIDKIKSNEELWDYPFEELDYLVKEKENQSFVIIGDRIKEIEMGE